MVKVTGAAGTPGTAQAHIDYIDRQGQLDVLTDEGERLNGKDSVPVFSRRLEAGHHYQTTAPPSAVTPAKKIKGPNWSTISCCPCHKARPQSRARGCTKLRPENFALSHRYAMVLHDPATDPKHEKTESGKNPHVHLVVKAVSETGERLYIRKDTLQTWREQFAQALREQA